MRQPKPIIERQFEIEFLDLGASFRIHVGLIHGKDFSPRNKVTFGTKSVALR